MLKWPLKLLQLLLRKTALIIASGVVMLLLDKLICLVLNALKLFPSNYKYSIFQKVCEKKRKSLVGKCFSSTMSSRKCGCLHCDSRLPLPFLCVNS